MLDAPGLILPSIHQREGRPALKVTVFEKLKEKPCITKDGTVIESMRKREDVSFKVTRLWEKNGKLGVEISAKGVTEEYLKHMQDFRAGSVGNSGGMAADWRNPFCQ